MSTRIGEADDCGEERAAMGGVSRRQSGLGKRILLPLNHAQASTVSFDQIDALARTAEHGAARGAL